MHARGLLGQRSIHARAGEVQRGTGRAAVQGGDLGTVAAQLLAVALAHARGKGLCGFAGLGTAGLVVDDEPAVLGAERKVDDGDLAGGVDQRPFSARAGLGQQPLAARVGQGGLQRFQHGFGGRVGLTGGDAGAGQLAPHGGQAAGQRRGRPGGDAVAADAFEPGVRQRADGGVIAGLQLPGGMLGRVAPAIARAGREARAETGLGAAGQLRQSGGGDATQGIALPFRAVVGSARPRPRAPAARAASARATGGQAGWPLAGPWPVRRRPPTHGRPDAGACARAWRPRTAAGPPHRTRGAPRARPGSGTRDRPRSRRAATGPNSTRSAFCSKRTSGAWSPRGARCRP